MRNGLDPVQRAPYRPGAEILRLDEGAREDERRRLAEFMSELDASLVVCSGFMPIFALEESRSYRLFMTLFQPSAYDMPDIAFLRGRVDGIFSDCEWSMRYLARIYEGHARVLRTALPLDPSEALEPAQPREGLARSDALVRIAIGGTLQPRKRQLEAVRAAAMLSKEGMRCGLIGVGVLSGGIDEVLYDDETGYLTRDSSAEGVAEVLRRALQDRENWPAVRERAQALLATDYSYEKARFVLADALLQGRPLEPLASRGERQRVSALAQEADV
jgi:glycosyltransferase involved in cell wall biosynthesis